MGFGGANGKGGQWQEFVSMIGNTGNPPQGGSKNTGAFAPPASKKLESATPGDAPASTALSQKGVDPMTGGPIVNSPNYTPSQNYDLGYARDISPWDDPNYKGPYGMGRGNLSGYTHYAEAKRNAPINPGIAKTTALKQSIAAGAKKSKYKTASDVLAPGRGFLDEEEQSKKASQVLLES